MTNPFSPPHTWKSEPISSGLDVYAALVSAVGGIRRNGALWLGAVLGYGVLYALSVCTIVGWIVVLPLVFWGAHRLAIESVRGESTFEAATSGLTGFTEVFRRVWGWMLLRGLLLLPALVLAAYVVPRIYGVSGGEAVVSGTVGSWFVGSDPRPALLFSALIAGSQFLLLAALARLQLVGFLLVDGDLDVRRAVAESWSITEGSWLPLLALLAIFTALSLPHIGVQLAWELYEVIPEGADPGIASFDRQMVRWVAVAWNTAVAVTGLCANAAAYDQLRRDESVESEAWTPI